jgi:signal transduction histidine kinase
LQNQLIEDLMDVSRIVTGKLRMDLQPVDVVSTVTAALDSVRPTAEAKGVRLDAALDPSAGQVWGDASRLQQVVWNLLSNAIRRLAYRDRRLRYRSGNRTGIPAVGLRPV